MCKGCHEQALTRQHALSGTHQLPKETVVLCCTIAKDGFHLNAIVHVHERACFCYNGFLWIQFNLHALHFLAVNAKIDFVISSHVVIYTNSISKFTKETNCAMRALMSSWLISNNL